LFFGLFFFAGAGSTGAENQTRHLRKKPKRVVRKPRGKKQETSVRTDGMGPPAERTLPMRGKNKKNHWSHPDQRFLEGGEFGGSRQTILSNGFLPGEPR